MLLEEEGVPGSREQDEESTTRQPAAMARARSELAWRVGVVVFAEESTSMWRGVQAFLAVAALFEAVLLLLNEEEEEVDGIRKLNLFVLLISDQ